MSKKQKSIRELLLEIFDKHDPFGLDADDDTPIESLGDAVDAVRYHERVIDIVMGGRR